MQSLGGVLSSDDCCFDNNLRQIQTDTDRFRLCSSGNRLLDIPHVCLAGGVGVWHRRRRRRHRGRHDRAVAVQQAAALHAAVHRWAQQLLLHLLEGTCTMREQKVVWPPVSGHRLVLAGQPSYWWLRMLCKSLVLRESQQCRVSMPLWCGTIPQAAPAQVAPWLMHRIDDALLNAPASPARRPGGHHQHAADDVAGQRPAEGGVGGGARLHRRLHGRLFSLRLRPQHQVDSATVTL